MSNNDPHLNLFFSYNNDNKLVENNMTRALIVSLSLVSQKIKKEILSRLLEPKSNFDELVQNHEIEFALQGNIPIGKKRLRMIPNKYIIALTGNDIVYELEKFQDANNFCRIPFSSGEKPDAWFFDSRPTPKFCFMIEAKTKKDTLHATQIIAYAKQYFGINDYNELTDRLIRKTWYDVVDICLNLIGTNFQGNHQEEKILRNLVKYLEFCKIFPFTGFDFKKIPAFQDFCFDSYIDFNFDGIPKFPKIGISEYINFYFDKISKFPNFKINID